VGDRPTAGLGGYRGLRVPVPTGNPVRAGLARKGTLVVQPSATSASKRIRSRRQRRPHLGRPVTPQSHSPPQRRPWPLQSPPCRSGSTAQPTVAAAASASMMCSPRRRSCSSGHRRCRHWAAIGVDHSGMPGIAQLPDTLRRSPTPACSLGWGGPGAGVLPFQPIPSGSTGHLLALRLAPVAPGPLVLGRRG
jgi:hypothetical protein